MSTKFLAIDTSSNWCSVAYQSGTDVINRKVEAGQLHSELVLQFVSEILLEANILLDQIDVFVFGAGPGSFTGVRIACAVTQGLAYATGKPVLAFDNLLCRALASAYDHSSDTAIVAVDARMHEVYCACYSNLQAAQKGGEVQVLLEHQVISPNLALTQINHCLASSKQDASIVYTGDAWHTYDMIAALPEGSLDDRAFDAAWLCQFAPLFEKKYINAAQASPLYVRDKVAQTLHERRANGSLV